MSLYPILPMTDGVAYGATTQAGAPTPSAPIDLVDAIPAGSYEYEEGGRRYKVTLPAMGSFAGAADTWVKSSGLFTQNTGLKIFSSSDLSSLSVGSENNVSITANIPNMEHYTSWHDTMNPFLSTHYTNMYKPSSQWMLSGNIGKACINITGGMWLGMDKSTITTIAQARAWIDSEASAGTPVAVRYQLAAPVTSTITPELIWDVPVTDHISSGYYGIGDLNRVGRNVNYIKGCLWNCGLLVNANGRTDWGFNNKPTQTDAQTYLDNLVTLRGALAMMATTPSTPSGGAPFNAQAANDIEQILKDVDTLITNIELCWMRSGEIFSGEV